MRQQFGINYTNSAMLYDQWATKTDYGEKEMSSEEAQALVDTYGKAPSSPNSKEFEAAKKIEEIKNLLTNMGISKWEESFPNALLEELKRLKGEKPPESPPASVAETLADLENVATAPPTPGLPTGDIIRTAQNRAIEAQVFEGMQIGTVRNMTNRM
jgi:hypothetical protein